MLDDLKHGSAKLVKRARGKRGDGLPAAALTALKPE
jgi:hypothetical protein